MNKTIFYSWQRETPERVNQDPIRAALEAAARRLRGDYTVDEATRDVAGSRPIVEIILEKIPRCAAFVPDITLLQGAGGRKYCNSSVCIEYGYALAKCGAKRIIPVMNRHFGRVEDSPFDLKNIAVQVFYELPPDADDGLIVQRQRELEEKLYSQLRLVLEDPGSVFHLSEEELKIAEYVAKSSERGRGSNQYAQEQLAKDLGIESRAAKRAIAELVSRGYLYRLADSTDAAQVTAAPKLFWDLDPFILEWDPRTDARTLAATLVGTSDTGLGELNTIEFARQIGWPIRRLNPALEFLIRGAVAEKSGNVDREIVTLQLYENSNTRKYLRNEYDPDSRRRG